MVTGPFDSEQGARRGDDQQLLRMTVLLRAWLAASLAASANTNWPRPDGAGDPCSADDEQHRPNRLRHPDRQPDDGDQGDRDRVEGPVQRGSVPARHSAMPNSAAPAEYSSPPVRPTTTAGAP